MARALVLGLCLVAAVAGIAYAVLDEGAPVVDDGPEQPPGTPPMTPPAQGQETKREPRVWIEWTRTQPLARVGPEIRVLRGGQPVDAAVEVLAAAGSRQGGPRAFVVRVREGERETCRRAATDEDGSLRVDLGVERALDGRIVDPSGAPIEGVEVWFGGALDQVVRTDADGRYAATVASGPGVPVVARGPGRAWKASFVHVDAVQGARADFVLAPSAVLLVQAAGTTATLAGARAVLLPPAVPTTEVEAYPFWAQDLLSDLRLDANGRVRVEGLPVGAAVDVALCGPLLARTSPVEVLVRADATEPAAIPALDGVRLSGLVVDERGEPVEGAEVAASPQPARAEPPVLLPVAVPPRGAAVARTGADGTFGLASSAQRQDVLVRAVANGIAAETVLAVGSEGPVRLVVPGGLMGGARFEVRPPTPGIAWSVRVDPWTDGRFVELTADTSYVHEVSTPFVGDVRVRTASGAEWSTARERAALVVDGAFALPLELTGR